MQPYFLPYLGYWQLIQAVDNFVIYDDVNYIPRGWVNRNRILINHKPFFITIPLHNSSRNKKICDILIHESSNWKEKMLKSIEHSYKKSTFFTTVFPIIEKIIYYDSNILSDFLSHSIICLMRFMGISTNLIETSRCYHNNNLKGQSRIIDICRQEGATIYINPSGGRSLYNSASFQLANITLCFIKMRPLPYNQRSNEFAPYLSIIDLLMKIGPSQIKTYLGNYDLIPG